MRSLRPQENGILHLVGRSCRGHTPTSGSVMRGDLAMLKGPDAVSAGDQTDGSGRQCTISPLHHPFCLSHSYVLILRD